MYSTRHCATFTRTCNTCFVMGNFFFISKLKLNNRHFKILKFSFFKVWPSDQMSNHFWLWQESSRRHKRIRLGAGRVKRRVHGKVCSSSTWHRRKKMVQSGRHRRQHHDWSLDHVRQLVVFWFGRARPGLAVLWGSSQFGAYLNENPGGHRWPDQPERFILWRTFHYTWRRIKKTNWNVFIWHWRHLQLLLQRASSALSLSLLKFSSSFFYTVYFYLKKCIFLFFKWKCRYY